MELYLYENDKGYYLTNVLSKHEPALASVEEYDGTIYVYIEEYMLDLTYHCEIEDNLVENSILMFGDESYESGITIDPESLSSDKFISEYKRIIKRLREKDSEINDSKTYVFTDDEIRKM